MSASSPVDNPKTFPAATLDDQDAIAEDSLGEGIVLGTPPHSSPDPATDGVRMLPLEDGSSAHDAALNAAVLRDQTLAASEGEDFSKLKVTELRSAMDERGLDSAGLKKDEMVAALNEHAASDLKAADFKARVEAATNQAELDAATALYEAQETEYVTVEDAIEKKQNELNGQ